MSSVSNCVSRRVLRELLPEGNFGVLFCFSPPLFYYINNFQGLPDSSKGVWQYFLSNKHTNTLCMYEWWVYNKFKAHKKGADL